MKIDPRELEELRTVVQALGPYLGEVVLVGGWAHRMFRVHPWARERDFVPLSTQDFDFAIPPTARVHAPGPISSLLEMAGYKPQHKSIHTKPPLVRYQKAGLQVEFVADLSGGTTSREDDSAVLEVAGVTAEQLRFVYPLQLRPWSPTDQDLSRLRVANPVTYLFQKLLVNGRRASKEKAAGDLLYVADTADLFGDRFPELAGEWKDAIEPLVHTKHVTQFRKAAKALSSPGGAPAGGRDRGGDRTPTVAGGHRSNGGVRGRQRLRGEEGLIMLRPRPDR